MSVRFSFDLTIWICRSTPRFASAPGGAPFDVVWPVVIAREAWQCRRRDNGGRCPVLP